MYIHVQSVIECVFLSDNCDDWMYTCIQLSNWRLLRSHVTLLSRLLYEVHTDCTDSGLSVEAVVKVRWKSRVYK